MRRGFVGTADGLPDAVYHPELLGSERSGRASVRCRVCRGVVRGGAGDAERAAVGGHNVSRGLARSFESSFIT